MMSHMKDLLDLIVNPSKRIKERDVREAVVEAKFQSEVANNLGSVFFKTALSREHDWRIKHP